jgi:hypothetical protein
MIDGGRGNQVRLNRAGEIPSASACAVLLEISRGGETGLLEIYAKERVFGLILRHGAPIHANPGATPWRLGEVIEHLGLPVRGGAPELRRVMALSRDRAGEMLISRGYLTKECLDRALKEQIRLRAGEFLTLAEGRYRFWSGPEHLRAAPRQPDRWTASGLVAAVRGGSLPRPRPPRAKPAEPPEPLRRLLDRLESGPDPYAALGLPQGADARQIRRAFRRLAVSHHPDRLPGLTDPEARALHARIFAAALDAYQEIRR